MFIVHVHALDEIEHKTKKRYKLLRQLLTTRRISRHAPCVERENAVCTIIRISMQILARHDLFVFLCCPFFSFSQNHFVSLPAGSNCRDFNNFRVSIVNNIRDSLHLIVYSSCMECRGIGE